MKLPYCADPVSILRPTVGGYDGGGYLSSVERYNEEKDQWEAVASVNSVRSVLIGRMYAVGGFDGGRYLSLERYDEEKDQWEAVASMDSVRSEVGIVCFEWSDVYRRWL